MAEEQVIKLLEEIRDLTKLHVEDYKNALKHQQEAIDIQKAAVRRQKMVLLVGGLLLVGLLAFLVLSLFSARG
jgi:CHASE3 domain sensor protein